MLFYLTIQDHILLLKWVINCGLTNQTIYDKCIRVIKLGYVHINKKNTCLGYKEMRDYLNTDLKMGESRPLLFYFRLFHMKQIQV